MPARWRNRNASLAETTGGRTRGILCAQVTGDERCRGGRALDEAEERAEVARGGEAGDVEAREARLGRVVEHGEAVLGHDPPPGEIRHALEGGLLAPGGDPPVRGPP